MACRSVSELTGTPIRSLRDLARCDLQIYNTEHQGAVHEQLRGMATYEASEYFGPEHRPGTSVDGIRHEDLMALSFADSSLDLVLSSDVLEHVPEPYVAHAELHRILKPGGRHVFTVPFHQHAHQDDVRARFDGAGELQYFEDAIYHDDPVRPEGVLVFTIFGLEMLVRLAELGFATRFYCLWEPWYGIVGPNAIVFEAVKT